jgi:hypothetical protein
VKNLVGIVLGLGFLMSAPAVFAFGMVGAMHGGGMGIAVGPVGPLNIRAGTMASVPGAVSLHGITVLPNGAMIVPEVTPRAHASAPSRNFPLPGSEQSIQARPVCPHLDCSP